MSGIFGSGGTIFGPSGAAVDTTAPTPAPEGHVSALGATSFSVTCDSVSGEADTTVRLVYRARGSNAAFTTGASDSSPSANNVLTASGLTTEAPLEAWLVEDDAAGNRAFGTHFLVTPATSIWATLLETVETVLAGLGVEADEGELFPSNPAPAAALLRQRPELQRRGGTNVGELEYPVEVDLRIVETDDTGEERTLDAATYQRALIAAFDRKGLETYPSLTGLMSIEVEILQKDEDGRGEDALNVTHARTMIRFSIWEART